MTDIEYVTKVQVANKIQIPKPIREALGGVEHGEKVRVRIGKESSNKKESENSDRAAE